MKKAYYIAVLLFLNINVWAQAEYEVSAVDKLNTPFNEFSPRMYNDGILYCSNKKDDIFISYLNEESEEPLTRIYFSALKENGKFSSEAPLVFDEKLKIDFGPFAISPDSTLYFTKSYLHNNQPVLGIFYATKSDDSWTAPKPFAYNKPGFMVGHPAFSPDGNRMYFAANFDDSQGKADLYYCDLRDDQWSEPVNLGPKINSNQSDLFPFIHADGSLFFSSERPGGLGGLDIYRVNDPDFPGKPTLLPEPFNSEGNDFGYSINGDDSKGFFSSNRDGSDDIFQFQLLRPHFTNCDTLQKNSYCYVFSDDANVNVDTLPLKYEWDLGDGTKIQNIEVEHCYQAPGAYNVALNIIDTLTGDLFFSQAQYYLEVKDIEQVYIEMPDTVHAGVAVEMHGRNTYLPDLDIDTYHWYLPENEYAEGEGINYTFADTGEFTLQLGVRSTVDVRGIREQACILRKVVVVAEDQSIVASAEPLSAATDESNNSREDGIFDYLHNGSDTIALDNSLPEETLFRVEIKKSKERLSTLDQFFDDVRGTYDVYENFIPADSTFSYAIGEESELGSTYPIYSYVKSMDYDEVSVKAYLPEFVYDLDNIDMINEEDLNNAVFRTGAIYFETNEAEIKPEAHAILDNILHLMNKYPTLQLEVGAHTDNVGDDDYNLKLSNSRAASVITYLVKNQIRSSRLIGVGYGSAIPIGDNESEEGRQKNRRVEFKVVSKH